jgi:pimeloyl-ACP methyl ester carboxylesterase
MGVVNAPPSHSFISRVGARLLRVVGLLLMLSAVALALSRAPDRPVETLVARWAPPPSDFLDLQGQLVHVRDVGPRSDPLPIVLIHGTSASLHTWEGWVQALQARRRVITFDLPGFGLTGPRADGDYRGDADARFVLGLLDALQVPRCVLGGNSLGGEVAWRVATLAPDRVEKLVLVDAAGLPFELASVPLGWRIARIPVLNRVMEWVLPRPLVVQGLVQVYADSNRITDELVDRYFEITLRDGNRRALGERLRQRTWGADAERVATVRQPTLILWGAEDRLIPPEVGRDFQRRIAGSELVILDGLGHVPHEEDPARTLVPLKAFLGLD